MLATKSILTPLYFDNSLPQSRSSSQADCSCPHQALSISTLPHFVQLSLSLEMPSLFPLSRLLLTQVPLITNWVLTGDHSLEFLLRVSATPLSNECYVCYAPKLVLSLQRGCELLAVSRMFLVPCLSIFWHSNWFYWSTFPQQDHSLSGQGMIEGLKNGKPWFRQSYTRLWPSSPQHAGVSSPPSSAGLVTLVGQDASVNITPR